MMREPQRSAIAASVALSVVTLLVAVRPCHGKGVEAYSIAPLGVPGVWKAHRWNKAAGSIEVVDMGPTPLIEGGGAVGSLAISLEWPGGEDFRFFSIEPAAPQETIPFAARQVSLWVKGAGTGHSLEMHFADAEGEDVKVGLGRMDFSDWRKLRATIPKNWKQPLRVKSVTIHDWGLVEPERFRLCLSRLRVMVDREEAVAEFDAAPRLEVYPEPADGLVVGREEGRVRLRLFSWVPDRRKLELREQVTDWSGAVIDSEETRFGFDGTWQKSRAVPLHKCGSVTYHAEVWDAEGNELIAENEQRLVRAVEVPVLSRAEREDSSIGVNVHVGAPWEGLAECGIHWARDYSWGWLGFGEQAPMGQGIDFQQVWKNADAAGISILPITMGTFRNEEDTAFVEDSARIRTAFRRLGRAFPQIRYWELDNEAEYHFPDDFDLANYGNLIMSAAAGLREAGDGRVVLNGTAGIRYEQTKELLRRPAADDVAVVNYHYYTGATPPEIARKDVNVGASERTQTMTFLDQLRRINRLAHDAGKKAWLTEIGWDVKYGAAVGERLQAIYLPRVYLLARWCGTDKIFWYFDRDVENSTTKFASCGLRDLKGTFRPAAAAMAALSKHTSLAEIDGSVDIGDDRWCILLKEPQGGWVVAAWSVESEHPMPEALRSAEAYDMFGNSIEAETIGPEITYFHLGEPPGSWAAQRQVELLAPRIISAAVGGSASVRVKAGDGELSWRELPRGVTESEWVRDGQQALCVLQVAPDIGIGDYECRLDAEGEDWRRSWEVTLRVRPAVIATAEPYRPGETSAIELRGISENELRVDVIVSGESGDLKPGSVMVSGDRAASVAFEAAESASGPVRVEMRTSTGVRQGIWLRPAEITVPQVSDIRIDGKLADWERYAPVGSGYFADVGADLDVRAWLGWSPEGLWVAASMPAEDLQAADPRAFWDWTNIELFVQTSGEKRKDWGPDSHQFWFTPVRDDGEWRLYAGEWKRSAAIPETIYDDDRIRTGIEVGKGRVTVEAFVPAEALGGEPPDEGMIWRGAISTQVLEHGNRIQAAWPRLKSDGLLEATANWGIMRFGE